MRVLALDTSSAFTSCALVEVRRARAAAGPPELSVLAEALHAPPARAGDLLPAALEALCVQAGVAVRDVQGLAAGLGPGSFTGLRVGLAAAKGLAYALRIPLLGCSSLRALAVSAHAAEAEASPAIAASAVGSVAAARGEPASRAVGALLVPTLEARKGELYAAAYAVEPGGLLVARAPESVHAAAVFPAFLQGLGAPAVIFGPGASANRERLLAAGVPATLFGPAGFPSSPRASAVARLCAPALLDARYDAATLFALAPHYLQESEPERALREGRVGKL